MRATRATTNRARSVGSVAYSTLQETASGRRATPSLPRNTSRMDINSTFGRGNAAAAPKRRGRSCQVRSFQDVSADLRSYTLETLILGGRSKAKAIELMSAISGLVTIAHSERNVRASVEGRRTDEIWQWPVPSCPDGEPPWSPNERLTCSQPTSVTVTAAISTDAP